MEEKMLIKPGKWFNELDGKGNITSTVYDESFCRLMGYEPEEFDNTQEAWTSRLHPDDADRVNAYFADVLAKHPEGMDYDIEYRMLTKWGYHWLHDYGHCTRLKDGSPVRIDGVAFDIEDNKNMDIQLQHEQLRGEVFKYFADHDDDPIELLKNFAERLRVLINCDQVIYRDLEETRIMVNSPAIEKTWSVPIEYCQQCQHFDAHHPMYARGFTEMSNCQEGWQGIPVYEKCPIKSSLTRIVYCDEEVAGYLAIHYVQNYHSFTDLERTTVEEFTRILSLCLSRFKARRENKELKLLQEYQRQLQSSLELANQQRYIKAFGDMVNAALWSMTINNANEVVDVKWSNEFRRMLGFEETLEDFPDTVEAWTGRLHPEDKPRVENVFYGGLSSSDTENFVYDLEYRLLRKTGEYCWYHAVGRMEYNDDGTRKFYGIFLDVSQEKQLERQQEQLKIAYDRLEKAHRRNELLHRSVKAVVWSYYINAQDEVYAVDYDSFVSTKTGIMNTDSPMKWLDALHPEDKERVRSEFMAAVHDHTGNTPYETTFRLMDTCGKYLWVKTSGMLNRNEDGTAELIGISVDITNEIEQEDRRLSETRELEQIIDTFASNYDAAYVVNLKDDSFRQIRMDDDLIGSKEVFANFTEAKNFFIDLVTESDKEGMKHELDYATIRAKLATENMYSVEYRIPINGAETWHEMTIARIDDDSVAMGFAKRDLEITKKHLEEKRFSEYFALYEVDIDNGMIKIVKSSSWYGNGRMGDAMPYTPAMLRFAASLDEEPRQMFERLADLENVKADLASEDKHTYTYQSRNVGENSWVDVTSYVTLRHSDGTPAMFSLGFSLVDSLGIFQRELPGKYKEALTIANEANMSNKLVLGFVNGIKWTYFIKNDDDIFAVKYGESAVETYDVANAGEPMEWVKLLHPDDREYVYTSFMEAVRDRSGKTPINMTYRLQGVDGKYHWTKNSGKVSLREDGVRELFGISIDVTEQMEKEREQQRQLQNQLALSDGLAREYHTVWLVDGFGEHRLHLFRSTGKKTVQRAVQRGLDEPTYDGTMVKYVMDSVHEDDRARVLEASRFETVQRETPDVGVYTVSYKRYCDDEGHIDYHQMCFAKAVAEDGTVNYILAFRDADKELREQMAQQQQLAEALSMAESANRAKTTFLNNMSHDIRTPMNAIIGYTGLAASHIEHKEQVQDYLGKIAQSSDHLLSLINDVLDMSRIESGKMNLDEKPENLSDIIHTLRDIVQADIHSKQLDFFVDAVDVNDEDVICDKLRLNQVLLNILSNAIKYTAAGGTVSLRVTEKTVKQTGYASYEFKIKDNGMGMDKEFLDTIFDPFTRVKSSTVSGIQGTGLGMAITKNIIDMMGGTIHIESTPGKGTEVTVEFDFKLQSAPKAPEEIPELKGVRALVADDDSNTCLSICNMVEDIGMRCEWCTSGKEAVIRAGAAYQKGDSFRVFIIDWIMPDMNGIETTRRIRKVIGDDAPIIILTAYDWSDIEEEAREAGVTAFVSKPMFPSDLHKILNNCIGREEEKAEDTVVEYDFSGKKVLLVEDNELNREIAEALLEESGFEVHTAVDGDVAVERMKEAKTGDYDLVLMDIQMPRMDGYEATRQIRALGTEISGIPILAMTANAFEEDRRAALEAGMNEHIAKPINVEKLKETLAKFL